jgi:hypothetical protein
MAMSISVEAARQAIEESMAGALKKAQVPRSAVLSVCLAAAGVDRQSDIDSYRTWIRCVGVFRVNYNLCVGIFGQESYILSTCKKLIVDDF